MNNKKKEQIIEDQIKEQEVENNSNQQMIKDLEERLLRIQAETQNYIRRKEEETNRIVKYASEDVIVQLLPVLDNFERAIKGDNSNLTDELSKFLEGFKMIYNSLINILDELGVKEIDTMGKPFDPTYHQAVLTDSDDTKEDGIVLEVLQKGYMLKDKVIRPTLVKVNNKERK